LWISQETGRLRGSLSYMYQGYFIPFHKQNIVTQIVGRPIASREEYRTLFGDGGDALPKEKQRQLGQAWAEYSFDHAIPGHLDVFSDYREIAPGRWFPFRVQSAGWQHNDQNQGRYDFHSSESVVTEVAVDRDDLQNYWSDALPKEGEFVQDQRHGLPIEYKFGDDRSADEIQGMVNEQLFEYARSAMLISERTRPIEEMVGKPAPALPTELWIGERPDVKGRRYLIHCWAAWCAPCKNDVPLLNSISKNRIVIGIHPSGTDMDEIRKTAADAKMAYPAVVAPPESKNIFGYPVTVFPYCIEVDENGNVARHGSLREVLGIDNETLSTAKIPSNARGAVLGIESESSLVAISLGESDGVQKGQFFNAMREERQVARLRIVFVQKNRSVGKIVDEKETANVKKGDVVQRPLD
jgi:thiol-disulfide isomerase/thioredoxin